MGHILVLVAVVMLLLGYRRFSDVGKSIGASIKEFKKGLDDDEEKNRQSREVRELGPDGEERK